jgi:hypothetical protein
MFLNHNDARVRLHALYVLEGLNAADAALVAKAMRDPHPGVRKHGLILAERYSELLPVMLEMLNDSSIHVVFQAALSAGGYSNRKVTDALAQLLTRFGDDPLFRTAVLSSKAGPTTSLLESLIGKHAFFNGTEPWKESWLSEHSYSVGSANMSSEINALLEIMESPSMQKQPQWQLAGVTGLKKGLQKSLANNAAAKQTLETLRTGSPDDIQEAIRSLKNLNVEKSALQNR